MKEKFTETKEELIVDREVLAMNIKKRYNQLIKNQSEVNKDHARAIVEMAMEVGTLNERLVKLGIDPETIYD